jgi:hypothetical protein
MYAGRLKGAGRPGLRMTSEETLELGISAGITAAIAVALVAAFHFAKPRKPLSPEQVAQNECFKKAEEDYLREQRARPNDLTVQGTLAQRRQEERYCLRIAGCFGDERRGIEFSNCLDDEYDVSPSDE